MSKLNNRIPAWVVLLLMSLIMTAGSILGFILKVLPVGILFGITASLMAPSIRDCYVRDKTELDS